MKKWNLCQLSCKLKNICFPSSKVLSARAKGLVPFVEETHKKGDEAHLFRRSFSRVKYFIDDDAGVSPTPSRDVDELLILPTRKALLSGMNVQLKKSNWHSSRSHPVELPEKLNKSVVLLTCESLADGSLCHVYLVGVTHYDSESNLDVVDTMQLVKPEGLFLELCRGREHLLSRDNEMRTAYVIAKQYGAEIILGDLPIEVIMQMAVANLPLSEMRAKIKYFVSCAFGKASVDHGDLIKWVKEYPELLHPVTQKRDRLQQAARGKSSIVAIVGGGHMFGIMSCWNLHMDAKEFQNMNDGTLSRRQTIRLFLYLGVGAALLYGVSRIW